MKRIAACCLLLSLLTVPALAAEEAPAYASSPWAQTEVEEAAALGLDRWTGVGDTSSGILWGDLRQSISRGDFASAAAALSAVEHGSRLESYLRIETCHRKVAGETPYGLTALDVARELGILQGRGDGELDPYASITRQEAAVMLARTLRSYREAPEEAGELPFADAGDIAPWAAADVALMYRLGVMNGVGEDRFDPLGTYTIEQCMASLVRLHENAPYDGSRAEDPFAIQRVAGGYAESWTDAELAFAVETEDWWAMAWTGPAVMGGPFFHIDVIDSGLGLRTYVPPVLSSYSDFRGAGHPWPRDVRVSEDGGAILYDAVVDRDVYKNGLEEQPLLFQRGLYTITMDLATGEQTWTRSDLPEAG